MLYSYKALDKNGKELQGTVEAGSKDSAITSLQRRGYVISALTSVEKGGPVWKKNIDFFDHIKNKDVVILSRQMATLFGAEVSALRIFRLLASESENKQLALKLGDVSSSLQAGSSISDALAKHPDVFNAFYISMVKTGEETGRLNEIFKFLADYLERTYKVTQKAKSSMIYPIFVIVIFITVMVLMLTLVIPKITQILIEAGTDIPLVTKIVIGLSNFLLDYGIFLLVLITLGFFLLFRYRDKEVIRDTIDHLKISTPYVGRLYQKLYLSRISDNLNTTLASGIPMVRALELTKSVVNNELYLESLNESIDDVKGGSSVSDAFAKHPEMFPTILIQMIRVGEETGKMGEILDTLSDFYQEEVNTEVDTLVDLIEPAMIILLATGVGFLLAAVLIPIYSISSAF
jgi:type IV pilus assembly protein PilC